MACPRPYDRYAKPSVLILLLKRCTGPVPGHHAAHELSRRYETPVEYSQSYVMAGKSSVRH